MKINAKFNTIFRASHNSENPFVQINKNSLWDENLSLTAVGLWARCLSRHNDWRFNIEELTSHCKEGRRAIDSAMKELIAHKYACRFESVLKDEKGKFKNRVIEYVFFEVPATEEDIEKARQDFQIFLGHCGFGNCRAGNCRNDELLIKRSTKTDQNQNIEDLKSLPTAKPKKSKKEDKEVQQDEPEEVQEEMLFFEGRYKPVISVPKKELFDYFEAQGYDTAQIAAAIVATHKQAKPLSGTPYPYIQTVLMNAKAKSQKKASCKKPKGQTVSSAEQILLDEQEEIRKRNLRNQKEKA